MLHRGLDVRLRFAVQYVEDRLRRIAAARRELCSGAGVGRGWATVCGFGCSAVALQAGFPPVLGPMASSPTHCANCVRSVQPVATKSDHEACFTLAWGPGPCFVRAAARRCWAANPGLATTCGRRSLAGANHCAQTTARSAGGRRAQARFVIMLAAVVERRRSACEVAAGPRREHRSAVDAKRRPRPHSLPARYAWPRCANADKRLLVFGSYAPQAAQPTYVMSRNLVRGIARRPTGWCAASRSRGTAPRRASCAGS